MFNTITGHYTATFVDQDIGVKEVRKMHLLRGFTDIGYHGLIRTGGEFEEGRPENKTGSHVKGKNRGNYGLVTVGGLTRATGADRGVDTRTAAQKTTQLAKIDELLQRYPTIKTIQGHRDVASTQCPAYDVRAWYMAAKSGAPLPPPVYTPEQTAQTHIYLQKGSRGQEVRHLQEHLRDLGFDPKGIDGIFGGDTEAAVIAFQESVGLKGLNMGKVGNTTWAEILLRDPD